MSSNTKPQWWVAGLGGVGGYIGGKLCQWMQRTNAIDLHFLARGIHQQKILEQGLELRDQGTIAVAHPTSCVSAINPGSEASFIFICCKSYDLESVLEILAPIVGCNTVLLPLLNGVAGVAMVAARFPEATVLDGGAFMVSWIAAPGVIVNQGPRQELFIGHPGGLNTGLSDAFAILKAAGIEVVVHHPIQQLTWEKFLFIAPLATMTTAHDVPASTIGKDLHLREKFEALFGEMVTLSRARGILFPEDIWSVTIQKVLNTPEGATTSMHRDFQNKNGQCEVAFLTEYPVLLGSQLGCPMPVFTAYLEQLTGMGAYPLKYP